MKEKKPTKKEVSEVMKSIASKGGKATLRAHGKKHFQKLAKLSHIKRYGKK